MQAEWLWGLAGGLMIGTAAAIYLLFNGRIMGASGIVGGLVDGSGRATMAERLAFLAGLIGLPFVITGLAGTASALTTTHLTGSVPVLVAAGLCVGIGTRLANGCTSGHGVCGISRLSLRGIVATVFYLLGGGLSVLVFRHVLGVI
ncbi:MAG: hypothetical protein CVT84_11900 [Alphaproteobacteria bacterium HGW-Alphaproteobacteria-6]|nr:MAG: hypothetical protein CVT84_11900 [Alphaproteobacteria bacterium HGW-Alphaproteobacteria-6]